LDTKGRRITETQDSKICSRVPRESESRMTADEGQQQFTRPTETAEIYVMRTFITCTVRQILLENQVKENEMATACSTHDRSKFGVLVGNMKEIDH
jgi:hypothetical protein